MPDDFGQHESLCIDFYRHYLNWLNYAGR